MPSPITALALLATSIATPHHLHAFDLAIVVLYLIGITLFGLRFRKKSADPNARSLRSYFLANNTIPWWAISLSIVSAETSTLTIISIPGVAFAGDFGFLQVVIGYMLGRIVVAALFLPRYFAGEMLTAYQLIDRRFGSSLHKVTAGLFLLTRAAAEGVRVFAVSIVVGIAIGTRDVLSIGIISALTLLYTFEGGMAAVIWTDVVQMAIYIGGTVVAIATLGSHVTGGWSTIHTVASAAGKFHMLNFALNLTTTYTFWAGVLGGTFLTMASHGTDQLMVQRMLAARNLRESQLALLSSGVVIFIQFALFLLIGVGLYVFYGQRPTTFASADRIFPTFIVREMPLGLAGLLVAAILAAAMSNLSAALNSLSSTTVVDFYMHLRPNADDHERNLISKSSTVLWALVLFAIAVYALAVGGKGHVVEIGLSIASVAYGCLLGVFLLGTLTKFATQTGATIGMVCGFILNIALWQFPGKILLAGPLVPPPANQPWTHPTILAIPHIAWTWYVLIGAIVTFAIGSLASLIFGKQSSRRAKTATTIAASLLLPLLLPFLLSFRSAAQEPAVRHTTADRSAPATTPDFTPISTLLNDAIPTHHPPGAVVLIGHDGKVVFEQAYGERKLANEPGLDGQPSPAEPMTEDTIFDMASLSKCLSTATAIMQLYEAGKIKSFDDPVEKYLPAFAATNTSSASTPDPTSTPSANGAPTSQPGATPQVPARIKAQRAESPTQSPATFDKSQVTIRMLLTHTSGEGPDISLKDAWGLAAPDKAEGFRRALSTPLMSAPGEVFRYSDINFILLGDLVETLSGQTLDVYAQQHIFKPLGMTETRYLPLAEACGDGLSVPPYSWGDHRGARTSRNIWECLVPPGQPPTWNATILVPRIAPTAHDNEGTPATNPNFDHLLRGTVHDPTTRRMGGVAGHAGVFSTAHDVSLFANALLEKLLYNKGPFPLKQSTLKLMTTPEQPGHTSDQIAAATAAEQTAITAGDKPAAPGLAPHYPAIHGQDLRGFGWDIDTAFSKPRGMIFPIGSFGHTGFTGTSLWMDPASDTYVIMLANSIHPRGNAPISNLRGQLATAVARALNLYSPTDSAINPGGPSFAPSAKGGVSSEARPLSSAAAPTLTGIDILEATHFAALHNLHHIGLLTNQTGLDAQGRRTIDILHSLTTDLQLTTLFSPEHGIFGKQDSTHINAETDPTTGLHVTSLYGPTDADKRPSHDQLKDLDAIVIDLQDAGVRFYTYETVMGYFLEAAAREQTEFHHDLQIILLDRPDLIEGTQVQGPMSDPSLESYIDFTSLPVRHGFTLGELAQYDNGTRHLRAHLTVIPMQHWSRTEYFDQTGLPWTNPSPNLRNLTAATLYPGLGLLDFTNVSVGRGTSTPFELFGAAWIHAPDVAAALTARHIPGVTFATTTTTVTEDTNHYPFHGQTIDAVRITLTDRNVLDSPELGIEILSTLHRLYPTEFHLEKSLRLIGSHATLDAITRGDDPRAIAATWATALDAFKSSRAPYLLYP